MFSKQTFPGCKTFTFFILFGVCSILLVQANIEYCWTEDDVDGFMNISCSTGVTSYGNTMSTKVLSGPEHSSLDTANLHDQPAHNGASEFYCMAFVYNKTSTGSSGDVVTYTRTNYTCATPSVCKGRIMHESNQYVLNGVTGSLYCCNSSNNCNTHDLVLPPTNHHSCFSGSTDDYNYKIEVCPNQEMQCMKITTRQNHEGASEMTTVREEFRCDTTDHCKQYAAMEQSCKSATVPTNDDTGTTEVETCCCKKDQCFKPDSKPQSVNVQHKTPKESAFQRTMLIVIGVALGILFIGVAIFIVRRSRRQTTKRNNTSNSRQYNTTVFRAINRNETAISDEDKVHILPT